MNQQLPRQTSPQRQPPQVSPQSAAAQNTAQNYLRAKVFTATPEQLQLMLYDGAIRFSEQARAAMDKKDYEASYNGISRAQKIIS